MNDAYKHISDAQDELLIMMGALVWMIPNKDNLTEITNDVAKISKLIESARIEIEIESQTDKRLL